MPYLYYLLSLKAFYRPILYGILFALLNFGVNR